jgi:adenylate cyclase
MDAPWRIELFGGLRVRRGAQIITRFPTRRAGALLAYLAYFLDRSHPRERLIELLWPEVDPEAGRRNLSQTLFLLRRELEVPSLPSAALIEASRLSIGLNAAVVTTDVADYEQGLATAVQASSAERVEWLTRAVALYRAQLLPGWYEEWIPAEQDRLAEAYVQALRQLRTHWEQAGDLHQAVHYARQEVRVDPFREGAQRELIRLLAAVGQASAALRQYAMLERLLQQELGAVPSAGTRSLVDEIRCPQPGDSARPTLTPAAASRREPSAHSRSGPATPPGRSFLAVPPTRLAQSEPAQPASPEPASRTAQSLAEGESRMVTLLSVARYRCAEPVVAMAPEEEAGRIQLLVRAMAEIVMRYGGRVDRSLGDGILAVFGTPHTHEDDPERAIHAAMKIRAAARDLGLPVAAGVDTGVVYVGGAEPDAAVSLMGPVVQWTARLQEQADPDQLLIGERSFRLTQRAFEFSTVSLMMKGSVRPLVAHQVERRRVPTEKLRGIEGLRAELVGRDEELAKLSAAADQVLGGRGQMVSVVGEAGVGKSRLVAEMKQSVGGGVWSGTRVVVDASDASARTPHPLHPTPLWLEGRCLELGMGVSHSVFIDLLTSHFGWGAGLDERGRGARIVALLRDMVVRGDLSAERLDAVGPLIGNLLSARFGSDWDDRLKAAAPEQIQHQTHLALRDFLVALARQAPLVLVFEDLHWADRLSLDLITLLMETLAHTPVFLLCLYRPDREHPCRHLGSVAEQKCPEQYTEIHLRDLTPSQSYRLVESLLSMEGLPASLQTLILERARGNPFFVEELVRSLIDAGIVFRVGGAWHVREEVEGVAVPETVQSVVLSRVDRLRPDLKQVLEIAAVIGRLVRRRLLEAMLGTGIGVEEALGDLVENGFIYRERAVPEEEYSFKHVLTQETLYHNLLSRRRAELHRKLAQVIETIYQHGPDEFDELLAHHYERSGDDEKAVEYLLRAGEKCRRAYLNTEGIAYLRRALDRLRQLPLEKARAEWRLAALKGLGRIQHGIGDESEAEQSFLEAIAIGKEIGLPARELVPLYWWLGDALFWQGRHDEMLHTAEEGLSLLETDTASVEAVIMNDTIASAHREKGDWGKFLEFTNRNVQILPRVPYSEELRPSYAHVAYSRASLDEAAQWLRVLDMLAHEHHDLRAMAEVRHLTGMQEMSTGDYHEALRHLRQGSDLYTNIGDTKDGWGCLAAIGWASLALGMLPEAEAALDRVSQAPATGLRRSTRASLSALAGIISLCRGRWESATEAFSKAITLHREAGSRAEELQAALWLGRTFLLQGQREKAVRQFHDALALSQPYKSTAYGRWSQVFALSGLEEAYDKLAAFVAFSRQFKSEQPGAVTCGRWFLEPAEPLFFSEARTAEAFSAPLSAAWRWHDPLGDCSYTLRNGLDIHAANGRDLWRANRTAPRVLRPMAGDFAIQTVCNPVSSQKPAMGGLLLWKDERNFLRLESGSLGKYDLSFTRCIEEEHVPVGRGRWRTDAMPFAVESTERVFLRLERLGYRVIALCSPDGESWFTVGETEFPIEGTVEVGLHAVGNIDRSIYPGAHPDGTAIRFTSFHLWSRTA